MSISVYFFLKECKIVGSQLVHTLENTPIFTFPCFNPFNAAISCFKLSYLQTDWLLITWISFFLAVMAFWWVFEVLTRLYDGWSAADMGSVY